MADTEQVFVYGTLRPPQLDTPLDDCRYYPQIAPYVEAAVPARLSGAELYDLGSYPAAKPGQGVIQGDLLTVEAIALEIMDRIEGHPVFFRRAKVRVHTGESATEAWIYWAPSGVTTGKRRIACGDWFHRKREAHDELPLAEERLTEQTTIDHTLQALVQRFAESTCSWLNSVRPDGRAHSAPVWHVWYQGRVYVMTTARAVKTANIPEHPGVVITHPDPTDPVIIEGWATLAPGVRAQLQPLFYTKYGWDINSSPEYDTIIEITPTKLLAWGKQGQGRWPGTEVLRVWPI
jgi:gamma-glutamylcyclotransferase (GGCT)/AIG2-like uncharacterized protein YtfP